MRLGYTLMTEQSGPVALVEYAGRAERAGFDFEVCSDHTSPWLAEQGHAAYAWTLLGAVAQVTRRVELMSYVTCPTTRYHPVVVAQKAATVGLLSGDRFTLGVGSGENLNEHMVAQDWPTVRVRHEKMVEALAIITALLDGDDLDFAGDHFSADSARVWDLPRQRVPVASAVSGARSVRAFAPWSDAMVAVEPNESLCAAWDAAAERPGQRKIGQLPICWDADQQVAVRRAREQFRWFAGGWAVNSELPGPAAFAAATQYVREDDVAAAIACGPDTGRILDGVRAFASAGFTDLALVQIGDENQMEFLEYAENTLLPALRGAVGGPPS